MDDPTVNWSEERYKEIEMKIRPFLRFSSCDVKKDVLFLPVSGLMGSNWKSRIDKSVCSWWDGVSLFEALDGVEVVESVRNAREPKGPFRLPIIDKFKEMGSVGLIGRVESGKIFEGDNLLVMPNKAFQVKVIASFCDEYNRVSFAGPGENLRIILSSIEEKEFLKGFCFD
ncbi:hypothetical protein ACH5RR_034374 [Cinchona calisaya]|uniref:Uncharacterized protein n=1 Tax=Cinchona calisaya TaxID=153742 RepID=A0ABD2YC24_9GENT